MRQLAQRITGRYHLEPLTRDETSQYIEHRLKVAGAIGEVFDTAAKREVYKLSSGVPRLINVICDRAMLGAYAAESRRVTRRVTRRAADEVTGAPDKVSWARWSLTTVGISAAVVILASYLSLLDGQHIADSLDEAEPPASVAAAEPPAAAVTQAQPIVDAPVPRASLREQLQLAEELTSGDSAMETLFALWQLDFQRGSGDGCTQAAAAGYRCMTQRGSLTSLRQYDRPAILTLVDQGGANHHVVLTALDGVQASVSLGGVSVSHPIDDILALWFGEFTLLWHPPTGVPISLGPGSRGSGVLWLRESLAAIDARYSSAPMTSDFFDQDLQQAVRALQRDQRLVVDGLAGRQTQIIINSLLGSGGAPRLLTMQVAQE